MKRVIIVILILLVIGTVGFYTYNEFRVREIVYVGDYESETDRNRHAVKRLYSSDVDFDAYNEKLERLISLEFTEEEVLKAALESGEPEFYPAFHTSVYRESNEDEFFTLRSKVIQELAEGQERTNFRVSNLRLEVITNGVIIDEIRAESQDIMSNTAMETPLVNEAGTGMTVDLKNYGDTEIEFNGTSGMIVLQYVFDVESVSVFPTTVLTDCFIRINVTVGEDENGRLIAEYSIDKASTVEEYIEGGEAAEGDGTAEGGEAAEGEGTAEVEEAPEAEPAETEAA
ncbi:MAG: hypothetical protein IJ416_03450 [Ruminiclostridium sp.]|nr:hypothetical protein [Ruminiclostridium sp.]